MMMTSNHCCNSTYFSLLPPSQETTKRRRISIEPIINYIQFQILTSDDHVDALESIVKKIWSEIREIEKTN